MLHYLNPSGVWWYDFIITYLAVIFLEGAQGSSFQVLANTLEFIKTDGRGFEEGKTEDEVPF